jgi:short-subunit dehydrogenase
VEILVNNAGFGLIGPAIGLGAAEQLAMVDLNVRALTELTLRFQRDIAAARGAVLNVASIAAFMPGPNFAVYYATKAYVRSFSEALAQEMAPLGVKVTIIEPGPFRTDFLGRSAAVIKREIPDYADTAGTARGYVSGQAGKQQGDPLKAVHAMMDVADSPDPPLHLILGAQAYSRFKAKLERWQEEMAKYESVTLGADFPEGQ